MDRSYFDYPRRVKLTVHGSFAQIYCSGGILPRQRATATAYPSNFASSGGVVVTSNSSTHVHQQFDHLLLQE